MKSEIVEKLRKYSSSYLTEEADVVYLIVQIGKIIESQKEEKNFPALWFYRNWVVHYQLDKKGSDGRTQMLDRLDETIASMVGKKADEVSPEFEEAVSFKPLHEELGRFLRSNDLEEAGFDYATWCERLDDLLVRILVDLPLIPPKDGGYAFTEFRFNRTHTDTRDAEFEVKLSDNKSIGGRVVVRVKRLD